MHSTIIESVPRAEREAPFASELAALEHLLGELGKAGPFAPQIAHVLGTPGKRVRGRLVLASAALQPWSAERRADAVQGAAAIELLHEASLVHDDICDASRMRRGMPSMAAAFDVRSAALAATYLAGRGLSMIGELARRRGFTPDVALLVCLSQGQILEGTSRGRQPIAAMRRSYLAVVQAKTGALLRMACQLGGLIGAAGEGQLSALARYAEHLAVAYQVLDDVRDVEAPPSLGKPGGSDIARGIFTWPVLTWLEGQDDQAQAVERYARADKSAREVQDYRAAMLAAGATTQAAAFADAELHACARALELLPVSSGGRQLAELARQVGRR